jgi:hypothetical protein
MVGWSAALLIITCELLAKGSCLGWKLSALSLGSWFISDTTLLVSIWLLANATLSLVFFISDFPDLGGFQNLRSGLDLSWRLI